MPGYGAGAIVWSVMPIISIDIPADLKDRLEARAAQAGRRFEEFVLDVLRTKADDVDYGAPPHVTVRSMEELEAKLAEVENDVAIEMTPDHWDAIRRRIPDGRRESA